MGATRVGFSISIFVAITLERWLSVLVLLLGLSSTRGLLLHEGIPCLLRLLLLQMLLVVQSRVVDELHVRPVVHLDDLASPQLSL